MDEARLQEALVSPTTSQAAEVWVEHVVRALGPRFLPADGFGAYWLEDVVQARLESALGSARELLGARLEDLVYRCAVEVLSDLDLEHSAWARPFSQPPARFWVVSRRASGAAAGAVKTTVELVLEDDRGIWWIWDPAIVAFHDATPGAATDFYYRANARTDAWVDEGFGAFSFSRVSVEQARRLIDGGLLDDADLVDVRYLPEVSTLGFDQAAALVTAAGGLRGRRDGGSNSARD